MERMRYEIVDPSRKVAEGEADLVAAPALKGEIGVLPRHAPFLSPLGVGILRIQDGGEETKIFVSGGYVEVSDNVVSILAQVADKPDEIDVSRAQEAKARAEGRLASPGQNIDMERARLALMRAILRLRLAGA